MITAVRTSDSRHTSTRQVQGTCGNGIGMPSADLKTRSVANMLNGVVQPKLSGGRPQDQYEKEADTVADKIMSTGQAGPAHTIQRLPGVQAKSALDEEKKVQTRKEASEEERVQTKPENQLQARSDYHTQNHTAPAPTPNSIHASRSGGSALPASVLQKMEHGFGTDLGHVRVHTDTSAHQMSQNINAQAFTTGHHIFFNQNRFEPTTARGQHLIAHELTHVVQQGHAENRQSSPSPTSNRSHRTGSQNAASHGSQVQRLGLGIGAMINRFVRYIPGWTLITVIAGFNPLTGSRVARNATNFLQAILGLIPVFGVLLFNKLQEHGIVNRVFGWLLGEINRFGLNRQSLEQLITDTYNRLDLGRLDIIAYNRSIVVNAFASLYGRITGFASSIGHQVLNFVKQALLTRLRQMANQLPGYDILTMILGRDPLTGQGVPRDTALIIERFLILIGQRDHVRKMRETGTIDHAAAWIDEQFALLDFSFEQIQNLFVTAWNGFSLSDLIDPIGAFLRTIGIFAPFIMRIRQFARNVARQVLILIKDAMIAALTRFARRVPGYRLLSVILGRDPISGTPVPRTPTNFIQGFMEFVPGGRQRFQNLQESGAIDRMFEWLEQQIIRLNLSFAILGALFRQAWQSLSIQDLLHPIEAFQRMADIFGPVIGRIITFAAAVGEKILEFIFEGVMGAGGARVLAILRRSRATFLTIIRDPIGFIRNLINAAARGFRQFAGNILTHLRNGLMGWLMGALDGTGIQLPQRFNLQGILSIVLQVMGLTYARMRPRLVRRLGEANVTRLEGAFDLVRTLVTEGPAGLWRQILQHVDNLRSMIFDAIRNFIITRIVVAAVTRLASMFNPAGAVIQAIMAIYNTIMFFIERINQIMALVASITQSIASIAAGNIAAAADFVEQSMARTVPVIISFMARLLGLGGIGARIMGLIRRAQRAVSRAIDRVLDRIVRSARRFLGRVAGAVRRGARAIRNFVYPRQNFRSGRVRHSISFSNNTPAARPMVASGTPRTLHALLIELRNLPENSNRRHIVASATTKEQQLTQLQTQLRSATTDPEKNRIRGLIRTKIQSIASDLAILMQFEEFATHENPLRLRWPKPASSGYPPFYIGPQSSARVPQDRLRDAKETPSTSTLSAVENSIGGADNKANWISRNRTIHKFLPHGSRQLGGQQLGIRPPYRIHTNKKFQLPSTRQTTPGGRRFNDLLRPFGYRPSEENLDADHVLEIQMGGQDVYENLWPLNSSVNRRAGGQISRKIFTVDGVGQVPMSVVKQRAQTQDVWIQIEGTTP